MINYNEKKIACDFIIFGALGDLSRRKLIPSLYQLFKNNLLSEDINIIGVARNTISLSEFQDIVSQSILEYIPNITYEDTIDAFLQNFSYCELDFADTEKYHQLSQMLSNNIHIYYLATSPSIYDMICSALNENNCIQASSRVVLEKPLGTSLESSEKINNAVAMHFNETQIYRMDHYLGKETVQNLISLRFANSIFASKWDNRTIDHVQITVAEEVGIEGRWGYFDSVGQLRDMVQNHLLQILTLIAMDPPVNLDANSIRDEKVKVLKSLRKIDKNNVEIKTVRGQYTKGMIKEKVVSGYLEEAAENEITASDTETFVAIKVDIDNWRWGNVPFYLRTGKRLAKKLSEIVIYFKNPPHNLYSSVYKVLPYNKLIIRLQPDEGIEMHMLSKVPGLNTKKYLSKTQLNFSFSDAFKNTRIPDAYERLLLAIILGEQTLFVRKDEIEHSWKWCDSILQAWEETNCEVKEYNAGSWGPISSIALMTKDSRSWEE